MVKNFQNRINQKSCTMSGIPSLKRSIAESKDETDKLLLKTIKYLTRLQADMATWNPEEARITRMQLIKILQTRSPTVKLDDIPTDDDDDGIDTSNIVVGKRQKRRVVRYQDEKFADLVLADVPEDEIDAALEEDVSEDDDDEWVAEEDEDEDEEWVDEDEEVENNLGRNRGLAEEKENDY